MAGCAGRGATVALQCPGLPVVPGTAGGAAGRRAAGGRLCPVQRLGSAGAAHGVHAGNGGRVARHRAALALARRVVPGAGRGCRARSLGPVAGGLLAEFCGRGRAAGDRCTHAGRGAAVAARPCPGVVG